MLETGSSTFSTKSRSGILRILSHAAPKKPNLVALCLPVRELLLAALGPLDIATEETFPNCLLGPQNVLLSPSLSIRWIWFLMRAAQRVRESFLGTPSFRASLLLEPP